MMELQRRRLGAAAVFALAANVAFGCGTCMAAQIDSVLPPVWLWSVLPTTWYLANAIIGMFMPSRLRFQPGPFAGAGIALASWGAFLVVGPLIPMLLVVPSAVSFAYSFRVSPSSKSRRMGVFAVRIAGIAHWIAFGVAFMLMLHIRETRSPEEYIIQWDCTPTAYSKIDFIRKTDSDALGKLRYLTRYGGFCTVRRTAEHLADMGDPEIDIPLLEAAVVRLENDGHPYFGSMIESHLETLRARQDSNP